MMSLFHVLYLLLALITVFPPASGKDAEWIVDRKIPYGVTRVVVSSFLFPTCCRPSTINISMSNVPDGRTAHLYAVFTDIDIPSKSVIKVYDGSHLQSSNQPQYNDRYSVWSRPVLTSSTNLNIVFEPEAISAGNVNRFRGFKLECSALPDRKLEQTTTDCPHTADAVKGGQLHVDLRSLSGHGFTFFDCVWVLNHPPGTQVYIHGIRKSGIVGESVEMRHGGFSEGAAVAALAGKRYTMSDTALYVRLKSSVTQTYQFVYGTFLSDAHLEGPNRECGSKRWTQITNETGYFCKDLMTSWCIPRKNHCDNVSNCLDASDEQDCVYKKGQVIFIECPHGQIKCENDICAQDYSQCEAEVDPCADIGKLSCGEGSGQCFVDEDRCDGIGQCTNRADEQDCIYSMSVDWWMIFLAAICLSLIVVCCVCCCIKARSSSIDGRSRASSAVQLTSITNVRQSSVSRRNGPEESRANEEHLLGENSVDSTCGPPPYDEVIQEDKPATNTKQVSSSNSISPQPFAANQATTA